MNRKYSGFTLIEMLIVMGIIIILMAVGIAAGRFAIQRASDVAHQNAADQLFTAVTSHLTDWREYPVLTNDTNDFNTALTCTNDTEMHCLSSYLSIGEFRGGTDATFYYWTDDSRNAALVCVSLGGYCDDQERGYYCTGTGFSSEASGPGSLDEKDIPNAGEQDDPAGVGGWQVTQPWSNEDGEFGTAGGCQGA